MSSDGSLPYSSPEMLPLLITSLRVPLSLRNGFHGTILFICIVELTKMQAKLNVFDAKVEL